MPRYEYRCEECGPFIQWLTMSSVSESIVCPMCENPASRMYSPPGVITTSYALRRRVEDSAQPKVVKREACQHDHHHGHQHGPKKASRPWMVGH